MQRQIKIFDTTLRDGEQAPGCSMDISEKIEIAKRLENIGVDIIEAGFAASSKGDFESVKKISEEIKDCTVASLARSRKGDIELAADAIKNAVSPRIHLFIATSPIHMKFKLKMTEDEVLYTVTEMVKYASSFCNDIEFSAEDATRSDRLFLKKVIETAIKSGANVINIPDTVGYATPDEMKDLVSYIKKNCMGIEKAEISVHCHNDLGMAVANSLAGVKGGATQIECAVGGIGERAGNASLEEIVMSLKTRADDFNAYTAIRTEGLYRTSKLLYNVIGQVIPINKPIVGKNAFAHESGIHQHGVLENRSTYEIMTPEDIGIHNNAMVLGKHSGKHAFRDKVRELGYILSEEELSACFLRFKDLCDKKKELSLGDIEAIVANKALSDRSYSLCHFDVHTVLGEKSSCTMRLNKEGKEYEASGSGDGPINAAYNTIDKIIEMPDLKLTSYLINSVTDGNDALGEVIVKLSSFDKESTGRGVSNDIIEASILAYINGINKLIKAGA